MKVQQSRETDGRTDRRSRSHLLDLLLQEGIVGKMQQNLKEAAKWKIQRRGNKACGITYRYIIHVQYVHACRDTCVTVCLKIYIYCFVSSSFSAVSDESLWSFKPLIVTFIIRIISLQLHLYVCVIYIYFCHLIPLHDLSSTRDEFWVITIIPLIGSTSCQIKGNIIVCIYLKTLQDKCLIPEFNLLRLHFLFVAHRGRRASIFPQTLNAPLSWLNKTWRIDV